MSLAPQCRQCRQNQIGVKSRAVIPGTCVCLITAFIFCLLCAGCLGLLGANSVVAIAPQITSGALPSGEVGVPFEALITASGGVAPYTWAVTGALPSGLSLMASSGQI